METSLKLGWEGRRRKVLFYQEEETVNTKTEYMTTIINLWTCKNFCAVDIFRASGEVGKVRLEKEADQEFIWPGHRILSFLGQGELLKEFQC